MTDTRSAPDADERLCPYCKCPLDRGYCGTCNATWWTYVASSAGPTQEQPDGLKPCPFCGCPAMLMLPTCRPETPYDPSHRMFPIVRCMGCHAEACGMDEDYRGRSAIAQWNRRTPDSPAAQPQFTARDVELVDVLGMNWPDGSAEKIRIHSLRDRIKDALRAQQSSDEAPT